MTRNDVLIIGAGPSGLFAADELARHGVCVRLNEREVQPHRQARPDCRSGRERVIVAN
jgi:2-polyprenyl-6-methoxyphenol hydroxylase-like FAD-dependent oxidoreductase